MQCGRRCSAWTCVSPETCPLGCGCQSRENSTYERDTDNLSYRNLLAVAHLRRNSRLVTSATINSRSAKCLLREWATMSVASRSSLKP